MTRTIAISRWDFIRESEGISLKSTFTKKQGPKCELVKGPFIPTSKDFRWLPDLDSSDFYPENYQKFAKYPIKLNVTDGTFYARVHTLATFKVG